MDRDGWEYHRAVAPGFRRLARRTSGMRPLAALVIALAPASAEQAVNSRPTEVMVTIVNSPKLRDGTFSEKGTSSVCGELPKEMNFAGVPVFVVQFPDGAGSQITNVTFDSKTLVGGVTSTTAFVLNVTVQSPTIGRPPAYALDTSRPKSGGKAVISMPFPGTLHLEVEGLNEANERIVMRLTCSPPV
jgi:hypothetical protein